MYKIFGKFIPEDICELCKELGATNFFENSLLIGTWAYRCYAEIHSISTHIVTRDVDFLLENRKKESVDIADIITKQGWFSEIDQQDKKLEKFFKNEWELEFLAHRKGGRDETYCDSSYNISATKLPYQDILTYGSIEVAVKSLGTIIRIPSPESFFINKMIIAQRRPKEEKKHKDLEQCSELYNIVDIKQIIDIIDKYGNKKTLRNICKSLDYIEQNFPLNYEKRDALEEAITR